MLSNSGQKLVEDNIGLAYSFVNKIKDKYINIIEYDDMIQLASLGLCTAADTFDPSKGYTFSTYAYPCMLNTVMAYARSYLSRGRSDICVVSLDEYLVPKDEESIDDNLNRSNVLSSELSTEDEVVSRINIQQCLSQISERDKEIIIHRIRTGDSERACGRKFGVSQTTSSKIFKRFKKMLEG